MPDTLSDAEVDALRRLLADPEIVRRPWESRPDGMRHRISGDRQWRHDGDDEDPEDRDTPPCGCDCDGDRDACDCEERCHWLETTVGWIDGNATSGGHAPKTAALVVLAVNALPALLDAAEFRREWADAPLLRSLLSECRPALRLLVRLLESRDPLPSARHGDEHAAAVSLLARVGAALGGEERPT